MGSKDIKHLPIKTIVAPKTKYAVVDLSKLSVTTLQNFAKSILPFLIQKGVKVSPPATIQDIYLLKAGDNMEGDLGVFNIVFEDGTIQVSLKGTETAEDPDNKIAISVALAEELYGGGDIVADSLAFTSNLAIIITSFGISLTPSDPNNKVGLTRALGDELYSHLADPSPTPVDVGFVSAPTIRGNALKVPLDAPGMYTYASWEQCLQDLAFKSGAIFTGTVVATEIGLSGSDYNINSIIKEAEEGNSGAILTALESDKRYSGGGAGGLPAQVQATYLPRVFSPTVIDNDRKITGIFIDGNNRIRSTQDAGVIYTLPISEDIKFKAFEVLGNSSYVAIDEDGFPWTWGENNYGELGHGDLLTVSLPKRVDFFFSQGIHIEKVFGNPASETSAGTTGDNKYFTVYFLSDNADGRKLYACGYNERGAIGDSTIISKSLPVQCGTLENIFDVSIGGRFAYVFAIIDGGNLYVWGDNTEGQLGIGTSGNFQDTPLTNKVNIEKTYISYGYPLEGNGDNIYNSSWIIHENGVVEACGNNSYGQLGIGTTGGLVNSFTVVSITASGVDVACYGRYTFFLNSLNNVYASGENESGQLGIGDTVSVNVPTICIGNFQGETPKLPRIVLGIIDTEVTAIAPYGYIYTENHVYVTGDLIEIDPPIIERREFVLMGFFESDITEAVATPKGSMIGCYVRLNNNTVYAKVDPTRSAYQGFSILIGL